MNLDSLKCFGAKPVCLALLLWSIPLVPALAESYAANKETDSWSALDRGETRSASHLLYIPIPRDVAREEVGRAGTLVQNRLYDLVKQRLLEEAKSPEIAMGPDRIVVFVDATGAPILPDLDAARGHPAAVDAGANELTFTFDSPDHPWTPEELATLNRALAEIYPVAKAVYGAPAFDIVVNLKKDPELPHAGVYSPSLNLIIMGSVQTDVLGHEILHAFRDDNITSLSTFEEGMTRTAEVEVFGRLANYTHWDENHQYTYDVFYEGLNKQVIGGKDGSFFNMYPNTLVLLRYQLAGYAWAKALLENADFLADFNRELYLRIRSDPTTRQTESKLLDIASLVQSEVEGLSFLTWYGRQGVFNTNPPTGCFLYQRINQYSIDLFCRDEFGTETMQADQQIQWIAHDHTGVVLGSGSDVTSAYGTISLDTAFLGGHSGRISIEATASIAGQTIKSTSERGTGNVDGLFGIIEQAISGTVTIEPEDPQISATTLPVVNGKFSAPELGEIRGRALAVFEGPDQESSRRYFTKDIGRYFLQLPAPSGGGGGGGGGGGCSGSTLPCADSPTTLCIDIEPGDQRFEVKVRYETVLSGGLSGEAEVVKLDSLGISQGGIFHFFGLANPEVLLKVLDGCSENEHFWVFGAAGTNLGLTITVRDTQSGCVKIYTNPDQNTAAPIADTTAFPTCN